MAELKKYANFNHLKVDEKATLSEPERQKVFSQFEDFLKLLHIRYSQAKKGYNSNGKQPGK